MSVRLHSAWQTARQGPKPQPDTSALWSRQWVPCSPGVAQAGQGGSRGGLRAHSHDPQDALPRSRGLTHSSVPGTGKPDCDDGTAATHQVPSRNHIPAKTTLQCRGCEPPSQIWVPSLGEQSRPRDCLTCRWHAPWAPRPPCQCPSGDQCLQGGRPTASTHRGRRPQAGSGALGLSSPALATPGTQRLPVGLGRGDEARPKRMHR